MGIRPTPSKLDLYYAGYYFSKAADYQKSMDYYNTYIQKYPDESIGYYMNARNNLKVDSFDITGVTLGNYKKVVSMTDQIKDKPNEKDRIKSSLRYLIEYYANTRGNKDSALYYTNAGIALDPADSDFVSMKKQIEPLRLTPKPAPLISTNAAGDFSAVLSDGT